MRAEIGAARCLVAVLDGRNPNVLYEVGFAHALGKPVIHVQAADADETVDPVLPFDIRTHRLITYPRSLDPALLSESINALQAVLRALA